MITSPGLIRVVTSLSRVVPLPVMRSLADVAGRAVYYVQGARRRIVLDNLARLAPNEPDRRRRRLARRTFGNLAATSMDLFRLPHATAEEVIALVAVEGRPHLEAALALGKGVIMVTAHLGPFELAGVWLAAVGYPVHAMVEDLGPDVLNALGSYRQATGMQLISMSRAGLRDVYRLLERQQMVGLVADRAIGDQRGSVVLPFGNGERPVPTGPAAFAIATGAPIVVFTITRNPARSPRYLGRIEPALVPTGCGPEERLRLTREVTDRLAAAVRKHPDEWYVFQPQWSS